MRPRDSTPDAHRAQIEIWTAKSPARRVRLAIEMSERAREIAVAGVMAREPGVSPEAAYGSRGES